MKSMLGIFDQALVSALGLLITVVAAHGKLTAEDFSVFSLIYGTSIGLLAVVRATSGELLVVSSETNVRAESARAVSWAALVALSAGLVVIVVGSCFSPGGTALLGGAAVATALFSDMSRFVWLQSQALGKLLLCDAAPCVVACVALFAFPPRSLGEVFFVWFAACVSSLTLHFLLGVRATARIYSAVRWWWDRRRTSGFFLVEGVAGAGGYQVAVYIASAFVGITVAGGLRAGQVFAGPAGIVFLGMISVYVRTLVIRPEVATRTSRNLFCVSTVLCLVLLGTGVLVSRDFLSIGSLLLGQQWVYVADYVLPAMAYAAATVLALVPVIRLRAAGLYSTSLRARIIATMFLWLAAGQAWFVAPVGVAWLLAVANCCSVAVWWILFVRRIRRVA